MLSIHVNTPSTYTYHRSIHLLRVVAANGSNHGFGSAPQPARLGLAGDVMNQRERLLVVDESSGATATVAGYLDRIGYRARFASSGPQALAMLRGGLQTDAVVYDAALPVMSGPAFVQQLRSDGNPTPVLLMSKPFQLLDLGDKLLRMFADHPSVGLTADGCPPQG